MKLLVGAVSAALIAASAAAQAEPLPPYGVRGPYRAVSDFDAPYSEAPPAVVPAPPRYGYGPGSDYGYREPRYAPPAPVYRQDGYRDGYQQDYGYAPAFLPIHEVYAILRDNGFSPLGAPRQRGNVYVVAVLDREGEDGKLVIDARSGRIMRFVPAFQWGEDYERMRFEPRGGLDRLPAPTVIRADPRVAPPAAPRVANAMPAQLPKVPTPAARPAIPAPQTAALSPKPADTAKPAAKPEIKPAEARPPEVKPVETKPVEAKADAVKAGEAKPADAKAADGKPADAKASETKPADAKPADAKPVQSATAAPPTTGSIAPAAKPAPQILPTATMPPAQGLE
ncbi:hypothetical protein [Bradyrhizobium sp. STM 3809]|uniref:hypothetical protein n=1 Tax=Bradyrhizobium sp. STM 3809 TaxID=551936 RepID=UPI0002409410|nr:hypothetical protein [Bradyrhizobium sp. STM 3809]CCE01851.1 conserved exported hypothetical protein [Bradyrhizobium sp. STM 3809]